MSDVMIENGQHYVDLLVHLDGYNSSQVSVDEYYAHYGFLEDISQQLANRICIEAGIDRQDDEQVKAAQSVEDAVLCGLQVSRLVAKEVGVL